MNDYLYQTWSDGVDIVDITYTWDDTLHNYATYVDIHTVESLLRQAGFKRQTEDVE